MTYEMMAIIFRGESVSGHPGARGGTKNHEHRPETNPNILINIFKPPPCPPLPPPRRPPSLATKSLKPVIRPCQRPCQTIARICGHVLADSGPAGRPKQHTKIVLMLFVGHIFGGRQGGHGGGGGLKMLGCLEHVPGDVRDFFGLHGPRGGRKRILREK